MATSPHGHVFSDAEVRLSAGNYAAQTRLASQLQEAFRRREMDLETLASELDLSVEEASDWVSGNFDLTLTELRYLANAIDAEVTYKVTPMKTRWLEQLRRLEPNDLWHDSEWSIEDSAVRAARR